MLPNRAAEGPFAPAKEPSQAPEGGSGLSLADVIAGRECASGQTEGRGNFLDAFVGAPDPISSLRIWPGPVILALLRSRRRLCELIDREIVKIDTLVSRQLNTILHHPQFQRLEASWRGLRYLVDEVDRAEHAEGEERVKIRVLSVSREELSQDATAALEFDQSELFRKVYTEGFDMPGAEPFGVLIGDYEFTSHPDDVYLLNKISEVSAAAFCPFVAAASPLFFGPRSFIQLEPVQNVAGLLENPAHRFWHDFRNREEARFVGLTLPRILMRLPYEEDGSRDESFPFREDVGGSDSSSYLWGNAAYALCGVLIRAFDSCSWFADIRGVRRGEEGGGIVTRLPVQSFSTDRPGLIPKPCTDLAVTEELEKDFDALGFIALSSCKDSEYCAFCAVPSVQKPKAYSEPSATANAKISSMLHYMLCVSRIAHYLKVRILRKIGGLASAAELETDLNNWINGYVSPDHSAPDSVKARYPLREARIEVVEGTRKGSYQCRMLLQPHYQLDAVTVSLALSTEMRPNQKSR